VRGKQGGCTDRPGFRGTAAAAASSKNRGAVGGLKTTGLICNFPKFQGPVYKPAITFKLGLKRKSVQNESCKTFQTL
jgi:hypothetical protein